MAFLRLARESSPTAARSNGHTTTLIKTVPTSVFTSTVIKKASLGAVKENLFPIVLVASAAKPCRPAPDFILLQER